MVDSLGHAEIYAISNWHVVFYPFEKVSEIYGWIIFYICPLPDMAKPNTIVDLRLLKKVIKIVGNWEDISAQCWRREKRISTLSNLANFALNTFHLSWL